MRVRACSWEDSRQWGQCEGAECVSVAQTRAHMQALSQLWGEMDRSHSLTSVDKHMTSILQTGQWKNQLENNVWSSNIVYNIGSTKMWWERLDIHTYVQPDLFSYQNNDIFYWINWLNMLGFLLLPMCIQCSIQYSLVFNKKLCCSNATTFVIWLLFSVKLPVFCH